MSASRSCARIATTTIVAGTLLVSLLLSAEAAREGASPDAKTGNLVKNPGAESGTGSPNGSIVHIPDWDQPTGATVVKYGATGGFPDATTRGPANRGANFFAGGPHAAEDVESIVQSVPLGKYATPIDAGQVTFTFTAWLGGSGSDADHATVYLTFYSGSHAYLSGAVVGPVTREQRHDQTKLMAKTRIGPVPKRARSVMVDVEFVGDRGPYNDAYADNLSLVLTGV